MSFTPIAAKTLSSPKHHTFLMVEGRWKLEGYWLSTPDSTPVSVQGRLIVAWNAEDWFTIVGKICTSTSDEHQPPGDITLQYRGHFVAADQYTYMLQHTQFGQVEGQGWTLPDSIVQRFWILGDRENRTGLDRLYRIDAEHYHWSSSIINSHSLISTMEVTLTRQK